MPSDRIRVEESARLLAGFELGPFVWSSSSLVVAVADPEGRILAVNATMRQIAGRELVGERVEALAGEGQATAFLLWLASPEAGWRTHRWGLLPGPDGLPHDFSVSVARSPDGTLAILGEPIAGDDLAAALMDVNESLVVEQRWLGRERRRLDRESHEDGLTGLANRRAFDLRLVEAAKRSDDGAAYSLVMLDIDHFKQLNDTFGHPAGDSVLAWLGSILRARTRRDDFVARYGGEEFVAMLPGAGRAAAIRWAERVRESIAAERPPGVDRDITVSLGVAVSRSGEPAAEVLARADRALYAAKASGRNRVSAEPAEEGVDHPAGSW